MGFLHKFHKKENKSVQTRDVLCQPSAISRLLAFFGLQPIELGRILLGSMIMAFALVNIHAQSRITEGGVIGLVLFADRVFALEPSIVAPILDALCYALGFGLMGAGFIKKSAIATCSMALFLKLFDFIGPVLPSLYEFPLLAAICGGLLIGLGCGLVVTQGGASGGDDALSMFISRKFQLSLSISYVLGDFVVLLLSLVYIPFNRIIYSLLTTIVSSLMVGQVELHFSRPAYAPGES